MKKFIIAFVVINLLAININIYFIGKRVDEMAQHQQAFEIMYAKEKNCLIEALWYEARGESRVGIHAVASVIYNRKLSEGYPSTYCGVVKQDSQFSYTKDNYKSAKKIAATLNPVEENSHEYIKTVADDMVKNKFKPSLPRKVLWYTTTSIRNYWTKTKEVVSKIGKHKFYANKEKKHHV